MSYDLIANNKKVGDFRMGAFSFPVLLEACGYLFTCIHNGGQWYCAFGLDQRMGAKYPGILSNDGFKVTADEAKIMARIAKNFVGVQRTMKPTPDELTVQQKEGGFRREDVEKMLLNAMSGARPNWPMRVRDDFLDQFEKFAKWAPKSGGFAIR